MLFENPLEELCRNCERTARITVNVYGPYRAIHLCVGCASRIAQETLEDVIKIARENGL